MQVSRSLARSLLTCGLLLGCANETEPLGAVGATGDPDLESSSTGDDGTRAGEDTAAFPWPDLGSSNESCTVTPGTCPPGYKCSPSLDPTSSERRCTPIVEDPGGAGDPCYVAEDPADGDSCGIQSICWNIDDVTRIGYCVSFCNWCGPRETCIEVGTLGLCFQECHPLVQDCPVGHGCYPDAGTFVCAPDLSGDLGAVGDPCNAVYACDRGNACVVPTLTPGCEGDYCCSALCDVAAPSDCLAGQECIPIPIDPPSGGFEVGICGVQ